LLLEGQPLSASAMVGEWGLLVERRLLSASATVGEWGLLVGVASGGVGNVRFTPESGHKST
jgi:hypothetical protein